MSAFRSAYCAATLFALVAGSDDAASQGVSCILNHYILDYPCGVQAGTPPPSFQIPPVPAGVNHWTAIGPDGANVVTLATDPVVPAVAFAGTTGSGVLKTTDNGASWTRVNAGLPTNNVLALAIDPATSSTLYAGTDAGVFRSTDGGQSWVAANVGLNGAPPIVVNALAIDPGSPTTLYAGTSAGMFKTTNGAASWTTINAGLSGLAARVIAVDPSASSTVYIGVDDNVDYVNYGVFRSTDGGTSWTKIYSTPIGEEGGAPPITGLAVDPRAPSRLYLLVAFNQVLTSANGGTWSDMNVPANDVWSLAVDPTSPATIYVGTYGGLVFRTTDGGAHWASAGDGPRPSSVNVIATATSAPATLYAGAHNGVFRSSDGAQTWTHLILGVRDVGVYPLAVDPNASSTIYAAVGRTVIKTTDGGAHWVESDAGLSADLPQIYRLAVDPVTPSIVYAVQSTPLSGHTVIYKSTDAGAHWAPPSNIVFSPAALQALAIAPSQPSTLFIGVNNVGVLKSTDGGASWAAVNNGLTAVGPYVSALAVDPITAETVYAATDPTGQPDTPAKIFKSTDGAAHWRQIPIALAANMQIESLVIDPVTPSAIYASYTDTGNQGGLLKSSDGGETWVSAPQNLPVGAVGKLVIGSGSPSPVYVATSAGIFASSDGAMNWTPITNAGLPNVDFSDLATDRTGSVLRVATFAGLFEYRLSGAAPPGGAPAANVSVIEYYHAGFGQYFITANPDEIASLDSGTTSGWLRTGLQFKAYAANASGTSPVCRFLSSAFAPKNSHFYTGFAFECAAVEANPGWLLESAAAFYAAIPAADGSCPAGLTPVYRLYNNGQGGAPNHRYTTDVSARAQMIEQGWVPEGLGPDAVDMCSPP